MVGPCRSPPGLSPRRRGNRKGEVSPPGFLGPIPAQAVGTLEISAAIGVPPGLSPRRRGNQLRRTWRPIATGPIPAQAGEPGTRARTAPRSRAYPRAGGGTVSRSPARDARAGLSPRRRGNHIGIGLLLPLIGPIPAQAGEPSPRAAPAPSARAYPRAGGGTRCAKVRSAPVRGLSPRRRGNRRVQDRERARQGPIPAQGGGTRCAKVRSAPVRGLSPRRRGNRRVQDRERARQGPIPAQAGEPSRARPRARCIRAYPRAGGGTWTPHSPGRHHSGLSPRRRGNRRRCPENRRAGGPIPAQAGEPIFLNSSTRRSWAYPRAGGGTRARDTINGGAQGLSPRRRGNRTLPVTPIALLGPIPAQAGEPNAAGDAHRLARAYPRAGGGTAVLALCFTQWVGLSPRRRGNLRAFDAQVSRRGPIPAQAGEPR